MRSIAPLSGAVKATAIVGMVAVAMLAGPAPAFARTTTPKAHPQGACGGDPGPYVEVLINYGTVYHVTSGPFVDDNGTTRNATDSFINNWTGTVNASVSASLEASESTVLQGVKATITGSIGTSTAVGYSHSTTYTITPLTTLHAEYAVDQIHTQDEAYTQNSVCAQHEVGVGDSYFNDGVGWHTWTTAYSG